MDNYMLHVQESVNLAIYLYAQTMGHRRMLYIRQLFSGFPPHVLQLKIGKKLKTKKKTNSKTNVYTDRDTGTQMTTGKPGHKEYK